MKNERKAIIFLLIIGSILIIISVLSLFFLRDKGYTYTVAGYFACGLSIDRNLHCVCQIETL